MGNFDRQLSVSEKLDDIDAIVSGINMLGEELKAITVSRDYFTGIFNNVSDPVFILNIRGTVIDCNRPACEAFGKNNILGLNIIAFVKNGSGWFRKLKLTVEKGRPFYNLNNLQIPGGNYIPVAFSAVKFQQPGLRKIIILTATDRSLEVRTEKLIIRAIIDTQEQERKRFSEDLHDSLTQELSAIKFYIGTALNSDDELQRFKLLNKSNRALIATMAGMRNICFRLMPGVLHEFGLIKALKELARSHDDVGLHKLHIQGNLGKLSLPYSLQLDIYRIVQEFISNAINHGKASDIKVRLTSRKEVLEIMLSDNGGGFLPNGKQSGHGLNNVRSRVLSHAGEFELITAPQAGTKFKISIPLKQYQA